MVASLDTGRPPASDLGLCPLGLFAVSQQWTSGHKQDSAREGLYPQTEETERDEERQRDRDRAIRRVRKTDKERQRGTFLAQRPLGPSTGPG